MNYPIAELFWSIQGEGRWCGTPMLFIRLAGCNVGKAEKPSIIQSISADFPIIHSQDAWKLADGSHTICTSYDGQRFLCDTDYRMNVGWKTEDELFDLANSEKVNHVCITGGEPFIHNLAPLVQKLARSHIQVHVETSGTKRIGHHIAQLLWITCSPKQGFLSENTQLISEWKFLVGPGFNPSTVLRLLGSSGALVYLQPIGSVEDVYQEGVTQCLEILKTYPNWNLSAQLHKHLVLP